ncbi:uncharacterized protein LOC124254603 isoform X2 [Haliotis rubra]|nr:uncharacterized protein LOC124254603 isoform X2 [Haliotis rubra]
MVVTCGTATCLPSVAGYANGSYLNSQMAQLHIASFSNADVGNWSCSDGNDTSKTCRTTPARRNIALEASCKRVGRSRLVTCTLNDHGSPPITLEMRSKDDVVDSTTSEGQLKRTYLGSRVSSYTCAVAGERSECVTPKSKSTTCGDFEVLIAGSVIIVILIPCVVGCLLYIKCANKRRLCLSFYIINGTLLAAGVVLLVMIFIRNTDISDYNDPLFLSAAFIVFAGLIVGIVASIILHKCHVNSSH